MKPGLLPGAVVGGFRSRNIRSHLKRRATRAGRGDRVSPAPRAAAGGGVAVESRCEPVGDRRGLVDHGFDLVEALSVVDADALLVVDAEAFVLAEVFIPGADDELLGNVRGIGRVAPHAPADRACAAPGVAPGVERVDEVSLEPWPGPILDRHLYRSVGRGRVDELRGWPVA